MPIFKGADELLGIVFGTQQKNKRKISTKDNTQLFNIIAYSFTWEG